MLPILGHQKAELSKIEETFDSEETIIAKPVYKCLSRVKNVRFLGARSKSCEHIRNVRSDNRTVMIGGGVTNLKSNFQVTPGSPFLPERSKSRSS